MSPRPILIRDGRRYLDVADLGTDERRVLEYIAVSFPVDCAECDGYETRCPGEPQDGGMDVTCLETYQVERLELLAGRLALGQRQYGRLCLATDTRDWAREKLEEDLDSEIYGACHELSKEGA